MKKTVCNFFNWMMNSIYSVVVRRQIGLSQDAEQCIRNWIFIYKFVHLLQWNSMWSSKDFWSSFLWFDFLGFAGWKVKIRVASPWKLIALWIEPSMRTSNHRLKEVFGFFPWFQMTLIRLYVDDKVYFCASIQKCSVINPITQFLGLQSFSKENPRQLIIESLHIFQTIAENNPLVALETNRKKRLFYFHPKKANIHTKSAEKPQ